MSSIRTISIVGRGDFGKLVSELIPSDIQQKSYGSKDTPEHVSEIGQSDVIFLSIPLSAYPAVLKMLAPVLKPDALVVDVCSVKVLPAQLLAQHLPKHHNVLLTHPLFGPQSIHNGQQHTLIVTNKADEKADELIQFCEDELRLKVMHMTNEEHDQRMAQVHALTFFIARGLSELDLQAEPFMTPSFQELLDLVKLDQSQSNALFKTIEQGNPFAAAEREAFIQKLTEVNAELAAQSE